ncbi:MAG: hypothetical protein H6Q76_1901 [Firmicutes bacterium]|nr:hypothetical protein [Bacillota bacterium]
MFRPKSALIFWSCARGASMTFLQDAVPDALKGATGGAYYLFWGLGMFVGPPLFAMMAQDQGYFRAMQVYAGLLG